MRRTTFLAVFVSLAFTACSSSTSPGSSGGRSTAITVGNDFYSISPDTVGSGATITWTWATPSNGHTVNWDSGPGALPPNSGATQTSGTYVATLTTAGTYHYHCAVHGAAMSGVIVVQ